MPSGLLSDISRVPDTAEVGICFHGVGRPERELEPGEAKYWITEEQFIDVLDEIATWPRCRISFDDGNSSDFHVALPQLQSRGLTAIFFPVASRLGRTGSVDDHQLRMLLGAGMQVGSHGWDHVPWPSLPDDQLRRELVDAAHLIADACGGRVDEAAAPQGRYNRRVLAAARRAGFHRLSTSDRRVHRPGGWLSPRFSVTRSDDAGSLRASVFASTLPRQRLALEARGLAKRWM